MAAGISLAAMNIPQAMGYAKIAGTPVITGLYTLLLPLVAFAALGSSAGGTLKELVKDLAQHGITLAFAHTSESLKADLDRQDLTEVIGPNRQFATLRECLAAYASRTQ